MVAGRDTLDTPSQKKEYDLIQRNGQTDTTQY